MLHSVGYCVSTLMCKSGEMHKFPNQRSQLQLLYSQIGKFFCNSCAKRGAMLENFVNMDSLSSNCTDYVIIADPIDLVYALLRTLYCLSVDMPAIFPGLLMFAC